MNTSNFPGRRERKQTEAKERDAAWAALSPKDRLWIVGSAGARVRSSSGRGWPSRSTPASSSAVSYYNSEAEAAGCLWLIVIVLVYWAHC